MNTIDKEQLDQGRGVNINSLKILIIIGSLLWLVAASTRSLLYAIGFDLFVVYSVNAIVTVTTLSFITNLVVFFIFLIVISHLKKNRLRIKIPLILLFSFILIQALQFLYGVYRTELLPAYYWNNLSIIRSNNAELIRLIFNYASIAVIVFVYLRSNNNN